MVSPEADAGVPADAEVAAGVSALADAGAARGHTR